MPHDPILDIARNTDQFASCFACGKLCFEIDYSKRGPECLTWCKPEILHILRVGRGSHATIIRFCESCLHDLGRKIESANPVPRV